MSARATIRCTASSAESFSGITRLLVSFLLARMWTTRSLHQSPFAARASLRHRALMYWQRVERRSTRVPIPDWLRPPSAGVPAPRWSTPDRSAPPDSVSIFTSSSRRRHCLKRFNTWRRAPTSSSDRSAPSLHQLRATIFGGPTPAAIAGRRATSGAGLLRIRTLITSGDAVPGDAA